MIEAAFDERLRGRRRAAAGGRGGSSRRCCRSSVPRVIALTPAGAEVREWISDTIDDVGEPDAKPALTRLPAPGSLLVSAGAGTSIVSRGRVARDRSGLRRRRLVAARPLRRGRRGPEAQARSPRSGEVRWEITGAPVSDPVWSPNEGFRVAYRSGDELRVVWGDGTNDARVGASAAVAPAWQPRTGKRNVLAYADRVGRVRIVDADTGELLGAAGSPAAPVDLDWTRDGSQLLVLHRDSTQGARPAGRRDPANELSPGRIATRSAAPSFRARRRSRASSDAERAGARAASCSSATSATRSRSGRSSPAAAGSTGLAVAPNGRRILVGWPRADQWLFIPTRRTNRIEAVGNIRRQFGAGENGVIPARGRMVLSGAVRSGVQRSIGPGSRKG